MARARKKGSEGCEMDMTPMIDVVFQLIIFFVVTLKMTKEYNPDIILEDGKHGETITADNTPSNTIEIEVGRFGRVSIHNATLTSEMLAEAIRNRVQRHGAFPVLIRGDLRARHDMIKRVMDVCTANGVWKIGFVAMQDKRAEK